jgi:hypothetical protein
MSVEAHKGTLRELVKEVIRRICRTSSFRDAVHHDAHQAIIKGQHMYGEHAGALALNVGEAQEITFGAGFPLSEIA